VASLDLLVIVGQTASGKSALAMEIAERCNGEIIAADSRTVYRGMDIGTAKPTVEDQAKVPHHLLDVVSPDQPFTAADFQRLANEAIENIQSRGKMPILVGGTGLYVDSVIYNFSFAGEADQELRVELEGLSIEELQQRITVEGLIMPENTQNKRYLVRTLERGDQPLEKRSLDAGTVVVGLKIPKEVLEERIKARLDQMLADGLLEEVKALKDQYGQERLEAMTGTTYKVLGKYLDNEIDLEEAKAEIIRGDLSLAKRQLTWFKRHDADIHWFDSAPKAQEYIMSVCI